MRFENTRTRFGVIAQSFHWIIAALIVLQFVLGPIPDDLPPGQQIMIPFGLDKLGVLLRHRSFGMTVLMLVVLRTLWRLRSPPPDLPAPMTKAERTLARISHIAFYVLIFSMPLTGWMMSTADGDSVSWFGLFTWPSLVGKNQQAYEFLRDAHHFLGRALFFLTLLHIVAALKHQFWNKDGVLARMLPFTRAGR